MIPNELKANAIVQGPVFPEPVQIIMVTNVGESFKIMGKGLTVVIQSLSETIRGRNDAVLVVSIPKSELNYTDRDE